MSKTMILQTLTKEKRDITNQIEYVFFTARNNFDDTNFILQTFHIILKYLWLLFLIPHSFE